MKIRRRLPARSRITAWFRPGEWLRGARQALTGNGTGERDDWLGRIHRTALDGPHQQGAAPEPRPRPRGLGWVQPAAWAHTVRHGHVAWRFGTTFAGALLVGYLTAAFALFPAPFFTTTRAVPDLMGMSVEGAEASLQDAGLEMGLSEGEPHPTAPWGEIVWFDPPAGMMVPEGTIVRVFVSTGPPRIPVPDVAGYGIDVARLLIESAGLAVDGVESIQTAAPKDVTVNTRPAPGSTLRPGTGVTLVVSVGAPTIQVPDLAGLTLDEAQVALEEVGLVMGTHYRQTSVAQPDGTVFRQDPPAGTLLAPGTAVNLTLVRRPQ